MRPNQPSLSPVAAIQHRRSGFTLVELLVVLGVIAVLVGMLMPMLNRAREAGNAIQCASNLRQLLSAMLMYAGENRQYLPPAHLHFYTQNNHRWHGTRASGQLPFDFSGSPMRKQLGAGRIRSCPGFEFVSGAGFERSAGGYGYNSAFLGSGLGVPELASLSLPIIEFERRVVNTPAKMTEIRSAADKIAFSDAAIANPNLIEYSFVTAPLDSDGNPTSPSIHFRHRGQANIAYVDGHVAARSMDWTYPVNVYGADNRKMKLGYVGPRDNSLFRRK
jgi:prepilin-type processing-associated H-X9-DG protein/prepilin-type N-terminal cleavage/methylation domain-containing protein